MINYADSIFTRTYKYGDKELYATFHPEANIAKDHYDITGRYLVVVLHPDKGLISFFLNKDDKTGKWAQDDNDGNVLEDELIAWCNEQIMSESK